MRELTEEEKTLNQKAIDRESKNLYIWKLSKEINDKELELIPKKQEIAMFIKNEELRKLNQSIQLAENKINILRKQIEEGVEEVENASNE